MSEHTCRRNGPGQGECYPCVFAAGEEAERERIMALFPCSMQHTVRPGTGRGCKSYRDLPRCFGCKVIDAIARGEHEQSGAGEAVCTFCEATEHIKVRGDKQGYICAFGCPNGEDEGPTSGAGEAQDGK